MKIKTEHIGILIILGGMAFFGYVYFQKQKPKIAQKQLDDLIKKSNDLGQTTNAVDQPFFKPYQSYAPSNETNSDGMPNLNGVLDNIMGSLANLQHL